MARGSTHDAHARTVFLKHLTIPRLSTPSWFLLRRNFLTLFSPCGEDISWFHLIVLCPPASPVLCLSLDVMATATDLAHDLSTGWLPREPACVEALQGSAGAVFAGEDDDERARVTRGS